MENRSELMRLLSALCDEQLAAEPADRLQELLADDEARRIYLQYVGLHTRLLSAPMATELFDNATVGAVSSPVGAGGPQLVHRVVGTPRHRRRSLQWLSYVAVAAATLAATVLVQLALSKPQRPANPPSMQPSAQVYVATLSQAVDVRWGAATQAYRVGARVVAGELSLQSGVARLSYDGGVELIVEGPARLQLQNNSAATLVNGKVVFRGDDAAAPFTLSTPSSVLVDLGTEYAVELSRVGEEVHVFSGEVQRVGKDAAGAAPQLLAAG